MRRVYRCAGAGKQRSRGAEEQGRRGGGEQRSRGAGEQRSRGEEGKRGRRERSPGFSVVGAGFIPARQRKLNALLAYPRGRAFNQSVL
jgi:hypothetical protein